MKPLRRFSRLLAAGAATGAMTLALSAVAPVAASAAELAKVRFVFDWPTADFELVPLAVGQAEGLYKDAGLDVSVAFPPDSSTTARMLASGAGDVGFDATTDIIFAAQQGVPIISIGFFSQSNNWGLIGRPGEPIDMTQLKGKTIAIYTDSWTKAMMPFVLKKAGLTENDVKQVIAQDDDIPLLLNKKIDLATNCSNYALADVVPQLKVEPTMLLGPAVGAPDIPVWNYSVSKSFAAAHPDQVKAWLGATAKAMDWATTHQEQAIADLLKLYPSAGSKDYNTVGWKATIPLLKGPNGYLKQTDAQWLGIAQALADTKQIPEVKPASAYYTNAYLD
jgi:ABC-type nitrate/sulfonate/bicarbonate transport system substrate-binding protein